MKRGKTNAKRKPLAVAVKSVVGISVPSKCYACGKYKCKCGVKYGDW